MEKKIEQIVIKLKIPEHFPDYDLNLIYLAFMPEQLRYRHGKQFETLKSLYPYAKDLSYQVLEFYGDQALYMLVMEIFREFNGTRNTMYFMHKIKSAVTNNDYLRMLSHNLSICDTLYGITKSTRLDKHNHCSDTLEALIGALFIQYGLDGMSRILGWFIDVFPKVLNDIRKGLAPYIFIPVKARGLREPDIIKSFTILNPRCRIEKESKQYVLYIDGLQYDSDRHLFNIIPIIDASGLRKQWVAKRYNDELLDDWKYICSTSPVQYKCDSTLTNRVSKYNTQIKSCALTPQPAPEGGRCNILTDDIAPKETFCNMPPYRYLCKDGVRYGKQSAGKDCPIVPLQETDSKACRGDDMVVVELGGAHDFLGGAHDFLGGASARLRAAPHTRA